MKKILSLILCISLVMCMATPAFATEATPYGTTVVSLEVDSSLESYTLTIPATVTISPETKSGSVDVSLSDVTLVWTERISVYMFASNAKTDGKGSYLVNSETGKTIHYNLTSPYGQYYDKIDEIYDFHVAGAQWDDLHTEVFCSGGSIELTVDGTYPGSGTYTDTLTFYVKVY